MKEMATIADRFLSLVGVAKRLSESLESEIAPMSSANPTMSPGC